MSDVRCLILSHKRAGRVMTHRYIANCEIVVPESQAEEYAKKHPELPQIVHPDSVVGAWAKRQWMLDLGVDQIQLDDDLIGIFRIWRHKGTRKKAVMSAERAYDLIQQTGDTARQMGAYVFGFASHANPMTFNGLRPFKFGGYTPSGAVGILKGSKLWFPTDTTLPGVDYWICLLNAYYHRYAWYDCRFAAGFHNTYWGEGGMTEFRAPRDGREPEIEALVHLRKYFGDAIQAASMKPSAATERVRNPGRRKIVLPYRV